MASLLQSSPSPHLTSPSKHASLSAPNFTATRRSCSFRTHQTPNNFNHFRKGFFTCSSSSSGGVTFIEPPQPKQDPIDPLKIKLLSVVSGLNKGLAASEDDLRKAEAAAKELESAGGGQVDLLTDIGKLQGKWKLIYSSAFSSKTLGGSRPGPPIGRLFPIITLGQVFQRIDVFSKDFDNIVELELGTLWPLPKIEVTATLAHKFELIGTRGVKITFEKTTVKVTGSFSQLPPFDVPRIPDALRQRSNTGSGEFEVTYLDSDTRITRGDRGELRVFVIA